MTKLCLTQGIALAIIFCANIASITNGAPEIPEDPSQLESWFQGLITPFSERASIMDPDIVEAEKTAEVITVRQDGSGKFKTIGEAVASVDSGNKNRVVISIGPGVYNERIKVERFKPYLTFYGDPKDMPVLTSNGNAAKYGTVESATLIVEADNFIGANLIIKNTAPRPPPGAKDGQALAMRITGDEAAFYNCKFHGFQDTLCDDRGNHFYKDCYVEGTVDFIFGDGRSIYLNSEIHVVPGDKVAAITAHARKNGRGVGGYSFVHCKVTGSDSQTAMLGRVWMEASKVIFSLCDLSDAVNPEGWSDKGLTAVQSTVYFGEYKNKGPGAATDKRVKYAKQLTPEEAKEYTTMAYIEAPRWLLPPPKV